jgi:hypothetical protein
MVNRDAESAKNPEIAGKLRDIADHAPPSSSRQPLAEAAT